jgi:hypothetical protein
MIPQKNDDDSSGISVICDPQLVRTKDARPRLRGSIPPCRTPQITTYILSQYRLLPQRVYVHGYWFHGTWPDKQPQSAPGGNGILRLILLII